MELVCLGGACDGARVTYSNPPNYVRLNELQTPMKFYQMSEIDLVAPMKVMTCDYELERLNVGDQTVYFYKAVDISVFEALQLLVANYAIGDPLKQGW